MPDAAPDRSPSPSTAPSRRARLGPCFQNLPREHGFEPLAVEGRLPDELRGTFYRNGPALFELFGRTYNHWFDGDGAVTAVRLAGGRAEGAVRVVESPELRTERARQQPLYGSGFTPAPSWFRNIGGQAKNTASINVLCWQGRLFALSEMAPPYELDPATLQVKGPWKLDGVLCQGLNAHYRVDPDDGTIYAFGMSLGMSTELHGYALPRQGPPRHVARMKLPGTPIMIHDVVVTRRHFVFLVHPLQVKVARFLLGIGTLSEAIDWRPQDGTRAVLLPRDGGPAVDFTMPAFFHFHHANAHERPDGQVVVELCAYREFFAGDRMTLAALRTGSGWTGMPSAPLERITLDPVSRRAHREVVLDVGCDFPQVAPRVVGREHRYVYLASGEPHEDRVGKWDARTGTLTEWDPGDDVTPGESTFVPRPGGTAEDDGHLLTLVYDAARHRSGLAVLDARDVAAGPVGTAWFDHHIPIPLHGCWSPAG